MERLTSYKSVCKREMICRHEDCDTCEEYCPHINEDNCLCLQEVLEKLAAYEDIGLKPEQIQEIDKLYAEKCKELADAQRSTFSGLELAQIWSRLEKLKEYEDLEEQGKLLKLPCAVGDTVYEILYAVIVERIVRGYFLKDGLVFLVDDNRSIFGAFGKTVFATREEAEAALKELEGGKGK